MTLMGNQEEDGDAPRLLDARLRVSGGAIKRPSEGSSGPIRAQQSSVARLHDERLRVRGGGELQQKVEARWLRFSVAVRKDSHHERHCAELHDDRFVTRDHRHVPECACGMGLCAATPKHHHQRR